MLPMRDQADATTLAQAVAVVIAFYWCISSLATSVGVTTLATAVGAATRWRAASEASHSFAQLTTARYQRLGCESRAV
jgi:hypothetical protein